MLPKKPRMKKRMKREMLRVLRIQKSGAGIEGEYLLLVFKMD